MVVSTLLKNVCFAIEVSFLEVKNKNYKKLKALMYVWVFKWN